VIPSFPAVSKASQNITPFPEELLNFREKGHNQIVRPLHSAVAQRLKPDFWQFTIFAWKDRRAYLYCMICFCKAFDTNNILNILILLYGFLFQSLSSALLYFYINNIVK
jgi:hypothetical protein